MLSSSTTMDNHPVLSIEIESHTNNIFDDSSTLSSRTESNRTVVITPNPKNNYCIYLTHKKKINEQCDSICCAKKQDDGTQHEPKQ